MALSQAESKAIESFAEVARRYCAFITGGDAKGGALELSKILATLHICALDLPHVSDDDAPKVESTSDPDPEAFSLLLSKLPVEIYWDIFDPVVSEPERPVCNSIADDLSDIYRDLTRGLLLFDNGCPAGAAWEWRFHFSVHWGEHLVGAQRALFLASRKCART